MFMKPTQGSDSEQCQLEPLAKACAEDERWLLEEMYGHTRVRHFMPEVIASMIRRRHPIEGEMVGIVERVKMLAANLRCPTSLLQEEQERELEAELEEDRLSRTGPLGSMSCPSWGNLRSRMELLFTTLVRRTTVSI